MAENGPDRERGERMKLWGVILITLLIVALLYARHFLMHGHPR